jgi:diguanylate cyclase (GGDEF)-like protein/PAS domain S-box-containing protein
MKNDLLTNIQPQGMDVKKWQTLVNMIAKLFDAASGDIIQLHSNEFVVVSSSDNKDNFLQQGSSWSWDIKSFCKYIVENNSKVYEGNAPESEYWSDAPFVQAGKVCSYFGEPIYWPDGSIFGTFCVIDNKATKYSDELQAIFSQLKLIVESELKHVEDFAKLSKTLLDLQQSKASEKSEMQKRLNSETMLLNQESIISTTLDSLVDAVIRIDEKGTIIAANSTTEKMFGYSSFELINSNIKMLMPVQYSKHHDNYLLSYAQTGQKKMIGKARTAEAQRKDGSKFPIRLSVSELALEGGNQFVGVIEDITEKVASEAKLKHYALYDNLTQCANRNLLEQRFEYRMAHSRRNKSEFTLAYIDLDKFKPINDTYGHKAGDAVLIEAASRIKSCVRETDLISRVGGDEFVILFENKVVESEIKDKLSSALKELIQYGSYQLEIDASIGFSSFPNDGENLDQLLEKADKKMYLEKIGKNSST